MNADRVGRSCERVLKTPCIGRLVWAHSSKRSHAAGAPSLPCFGASAAVDQLGLDDPDHGKRQVGVGCSGVRLGHLVLLD